MSEVLNVDQLCVNAIRTLSIDAIRRANSGHPGLPMGAAPMAYALWQRHLKHNPEAPTWPDRDRFVLSAGHGSMLLYSLLHLTGYISLDEIKNFRQWGSLTPGHPEAYVTPGVEATTGPLGQGTANAVGMAIAERALAHRFNKPGHTIVDHYTYALVSDGDIMEGISAEASSLAGHMKLGKLIYLYDSNGISLDGPTTLAFSTENVAKRYEAYGWQVLTVDDGDEGIDTIDDAIAQAKADTTRPSMIIVNTTIGYGAPQQGTAKAHGNPLKDDEIEATKKTLGWFSMEPFAVPDEVYAHYKTSVDAGQQAHQNWQSRFDAWAKEYPELVKQWNQAMAGELPADWDAELPVFEPGQSIATRKTGGAALNAVADKVPFLMGGDADLSCSTNTSIKSDCSFDGQTGAGRNIHFGVRELAMAGIANGIAYHGGLRPFVSTFFCFSDYMRPSIRIAALSELPVIYVWTHDSIGVGEDGPTHQPVEHLMSLRAIPNLAVIRPCDGNETAEGWRWAMQHKKGPVAFVLSRQNLPVLDRTRYGSAAGTAKGAYILSEAEGGNPQAIIIATGSEVEAALDAQKLLADKGIPARVVSMPCWEAFIAQDKAYQDEVLPPAVTARVSVEAGTTFGWSKWVGTKGEAIGIDRFGASSPAEINLEKFGITAAHIAEHVVQLVKG